MLDRIGREPKIAMSGGVAYNQGVVRELERELSQKLFIPDRPQTLGALGAALFARDLEQ
jgi:activator of 2-hydroxyglutaryl-CoA dehydratase